MKTLQCSVVFYILGVLCMKINAQFPIWPSSYDVLGPFPKGMREIGADTLEAYGITLSHQNPIDYRFNLFYSERRKLNLPNRIRNQWPNYLDVRRIRRIRPRTRKLPFLGRNISSIALRLGFFTMERLGFRRLSNSSRRKVSTNFVVF
jgi:hypothetical protein